MGVCWFFLFQGCVMCEMYLCVCVSFGVKGSCICLTLALGA